MAERISEHDLILPALFCMSRADNNTLSTSDLIHHLRDLLQPTGEDLEILSGRTDDKFSQKVRNLRSHGSLEGTGYCTYDEGQWTLTEAGIEYLASEQIIQYLLESGFDYDDVQQLLSNVSMTATRHPSRQIVLFDETATVDEGVEATVRRKSYLRSNKLRQYAIEHFTVKGRIVCHACGFDFEAFYGEHGAGFIEIHHTKPIFAYSDEDINQTMREAIKNLVPLCSNCHRMIHRKRGKMLSLDDLKAKIAEQNNS